MQHETSIHVAFGMQRLELGGNGTATMPVPAHHRSRCARFAARPVITSKPNTPTFSPAGCLFSFARRREPESREADEQCGHSLLNGV